MRKTNTGRVLEFFERRRHGSAVGMTQNHYQPSAELRGSVFDAADLRWLGNIARHANDEQVTDTLVENKLYRYPRIGTAQDNREGLLT